MKIKDFCKKVKQGFDEGLDNFKVDLEIINQREIMITERIVSVLENGEKLRQECQDRLREFVTNKSLPLLTRFQVWKNFCDKTIHHTRDIPLVERLALYDIKILDCNYVNWQDILFETEEKQLVMEMLIEENFGSIDTRRKHGNQR